MKRILRNRFKSLAKIRFPETIEKERPYHEGTTAYHCDSGEHILNRFDWGLYMDFADRYLK